MNKPIIFTFVAHYLPGYKFGGPIRTIANMIEQIGDEFDFFIFTADRDVLEIEPYPDVKIDDWNAIGHAKVYYASQSLKSILNIIRFIRNESYDILYLNSFFNPQYTILPLFTQWLRLSPFKTTLIAPRGEFSTGALKIKSWKKLLYIAFASKIGIFSRVVWHASSKHEANDIRQIMGKLAKRIFIAQDLPSINNGTYNFIELPSDNSKPLQVVYLSRISPMKNLDYALRCLSMIKVTVNFHIYGVIDDEKYWQECQDQIVRLPKHVKVTYYGGISHENVISTLSKYDLFFLPTRGENYGHVIIEALSAGIPVLISDQTPWHDFDQNGVGFVRSLSNELNFVEVIQSQAELDITSRNIQRKKIYLYAQQVLSNNSMIMQNREMFRSLMKK